MESLDLVHAQVFRRWRSREQHSRLSVMQVEREMFLASEKAFAKQDGNTDSPLAN